MNDAFRRLVSRITANQLARDTVTMSMGQVFRLALQACYFIAIARTLGPKQYGAFVAIAAMVGLATPFAGIGGPGILVKNVSRDRELLGTYWGNGILLIIGSGALFTGVLVVFGPHFFGRGLLIPILCFSVSELILVRIVELASFAWTALGRMRETALLNVYISLSRLLCIIALAFIKKNPNAQDWCLAILLASVVCCLYSVRCIGPIGGIAFDLKLLKRNLTEGTYFAVGASAATFYNDIDKTMLARMSDLGSTGLYGAAYRLIDVSMAPIKAMTASAYAEFFRRGLQGPKATSDYAYKLIKRASLFGIALFIGALVCAPVLPLILGKSFSHSVEALRWLAILPLLRCGHYFLGDAITGAGFNATRTIIQVGVALLNVGVNFYFIPHWSWRGAAWSSILCDAVLAISFASALAIIKRVQRRSEAAIEIGAETRNTPAAFVGSALGSERS